jgi:hypothetical protein
VGDGVDYSEYAEMKAGETHKSFEATMSAVAVKKRGDAQFSTAYSVWRKLLRMYPVSERVQHQLIGYAFAGTAKASFLKMTSEPKNADATPEALWNVMAKQLYNDTMVRSQRSAFTSAKLDSDSGETVDDLSERLQNLAVGLQELEGAAGDAVLLQRFTDALPEELQVHAYGNSGDYDHLVASLSRIQKTLGKKDKPGLTWRARRAEQVNEILGRTSTYHDDDLSMEEVVQAIQDLRGGHASDERRDGWRGRGGGSRDAAAASRYFHTGETTAASIEALVIDSSAPLGHRTNPVGPDPSVPMERQFYSTTRKCFGCNRFGHTRTAPDGSQICKWDPLEGNGQGRAAGRGGAART